MGNIPPDIFENLDFVFSFVFVSRIFFGQLVHTQKRRTEIHFLFFWWILWRGVDPSKKMRDVRTFLFHPFSRRELRYVSENKGFRFVKIIDW